MDVFDFDNIKAEKANAILRYNRLKTIKKLFRLVELCLGLVLLSWTSSRLPFAVKLSGEYFRRLITIVISPLFIFIISNFIILALLFKSSHHLSPITQETDLYEEFINVSSENFTHFREEKPEPEEVVYEDKETVFEVKSVKVSDSEGVDAVGVTELDKRVTKMYRRSKSENLERESRVVERISGKLRRSETEKCRSVANHDDVNTEPEAEYVFDQLSNEEFQRTIEAFIAKQVKFHQEEKLAIVLHSQA